MKLKHLKDIEEIGIQKISIQDGGILFEGQINDIYKINYLSRYGMHLYWEISEFSFDSKKIYNEHRNSSQQ